ncbi:MAG TPA: sulfite oxidase-like oxidoreductase [Planctomycetota bacterium]|nr:sulfite oxidase-like oxidoreductase [Planctomycetota bacterium]
MSGADDVPNEKLIRKKTEQAEQKRPSPAASPRAASPYGERLPPGQHVAQGWPVLDLGVKPAVPEAKWMLEVDGLVETPRTFDWAAFKALPQSERTTDFHCVTTWSTFDNRWSGVLFKDLCAAVGVKPQARFVVFASYDGYTTNLPLDACMDDDVLLVHAWNGAPLSRDHGGPVRMIVPKRYAWKSAKWLRGITFLAADAPGFWEVRGYSNTALPWAEDRFSP